MTKAPRFFRPISDATERKCEVCGGPASFGYGVRLIKSVEGRWYCRAHRPADELQDPRGAA